MPTKLFFCFIFAVIFMGLSIVRIVKRKDDSLFCYLYDLALAFMVISAIAVGIMCMFDFIDAKNDKENKYEAVYSEEILKFKNCYDKNGYHVCINDLGKEVIVDKYWKRGEKAKEDEQISEEDFSPNLKYKGMKDNEVKKYVSCKDEGSSPVCTAEDGTKHEVDSYWRFKTKKEKEEEEGGGTNVSTNIVPFIVSH